jgi:hypothetical protein
VEVKSQKERILCSRAFLTSCTRLQKYRVIPRGIDLAGNWGAAGKKTGGWSLKLKGEIQGKSRKRVSRSPAWQAGVSAGMLPEVMEPCVFYWT